MIFRSTGIVSQQEQVMPRFYTSIIPCYIISYRAVILLFLLFFASLSQRLHANFSEIPPAPESMVWDYNDVYLRNAEAKKALEQSLVSFQNDSNYSLYVVAFDNTIGFDLKEVLPQIREKWLDHRDGMIIAVDIDRSILYLEEVPFVHNEQANDTLIPRLLPFMQSHIRPECITLAKQARDQHVHGIPLIDFYANGLTKKIKEIIETPDKSVISRKSLLIALGSFVLLCALTYFIILRIKRRAEKERHKRDFFRVYYFPKNSQLGRMGAIHGCMITQRQYDPNPSGKFVYTEKIRVKNIRYGPPIK